MDDQRDHLRHARDGIVPALFLEGVARRGHFVGAEAAPADVLGHLQVGEVGLNQLLVNRRVVAFPREVELFALFVGHVLREEFVDLLLDLPGAFAKVEFDRNFTDIGQARRLTGIEPPAGFGQPVLGIARDQRPGLGAQVEQVDVVFERQADAAEGLHRMAHRATGGAGGVPDRQADLRAGFRRAVGDRAHCLPGEELGRIDLADQVGHRVRQRLEGADQLAERLALAGIGRRLQQRRARQARQRQGHQQLPFLDGTGESRQRIGSAGQHGRGQGGEIQLGDRGGGEVGLGLAGFGRNRDQHDVAALARHHRVGDQPAGHPLPPEFGDIVHRDRHDLAAGEHIAQQRVLPAQLREQPRRHQRFGERAGGERAPGLFHQHTSVEQAQTEAARLLRHPQPERTEFGEALPQLGVEPGGHGGADPAARAVVVKIAREHVAHHLLFFGEIEIHGCSVPFKRRFSRACRGISCNRNLWVTPRRLPTTGAPS